MFAVATAFNGSAQFLKTDSVGNALWNVGFTDSTFYNLFFDQITPDSGNTFVTAGNFDIFNPSINAAARIDSAGNLLSMHQYNNYSNCHSYSHYFNPQTGLAMFGYGGGFNNFGFYFCKTDSVLTTPCMSTPSTFTTYSYSVTDSATSILSQPVSLVSIDVLAQMSVNSISFTDSSLCPLVSSVPSFQNQNTLQVLNADVSLYPNPFSSQLTFSLASNEKTTASLYNFVGQRVLQQTFSNSTTINTEQLPEGIYYYALHNYKGVFKTGKVIKQ
ncbi:MAG TPA: T9SS type A sorting domain-containing protein [Bacteroidia bacterium]|nr:T9SS type A sorting domain-containing protein [Bacteroidia bacterium]MBP7715497.1 T9SS type A sorting domain-containing protein [Bacteroidia bacterium]MBP8667621.1 T9SS type A sorting domain-containing protein [Bacteroidia bacterium]HOZ82009.1 T9SS type A sorting domain-containing protein [Bacteroidia bacterium]HOZ90190.1 T9SS type A sorting domain-containing protein [Bacteroidia bacterium]